MATTPSKRRAAPLDEIRAKDPVTLTGSEIELLLHECERRIALFDVFLASEEWTLMRQRLEARSRTLGHEREGLIRRLGRPVKDQPPVADTQIAYQQGRIDENAELLLSPQVALTLWRGELEQLHQIRPSARR